MRLSPSPCACHSPLHSSYLNKWSRGRRRATISSAQHHHSGDGARRPTLILPGFLQGAVSYQSLQDALAPYSAGVSILPIEQTDWIPALQGKPFDWYLDLLDEEADKLLDGAESNKLNIVAHSAGGWLLRIWLCEHTYHGKVYSRRDRVASAVCLGSPHASTELYPFGRVEENRLGESPDMSDEARGSSLQFARSFGAGDDILTCVCGTSVTATTPSVNSLIENFDGVLASFTYQSNLPKGASTEGVRGDGVTPVDVSFTSNARRVVEVDATHDASSYANTVHMWIDDLLM